MSKIVDGIEINQAGDPPPWSPREKVAIETIILRTKTSREDIASVDLAKADKIIPASAGNFASLDASGNLVDSGVSTNDLAWVTVYEGDWIVGSATSARDDYMNLFKIPANADGLKNQGSVIMRISATAPSGVVTQVVISYSGSFAESSWTYLSGSNTSNGSTGYLSGVFTEQSAETEGGTPDACIGIVKTVVLTDIKVEVFHIENCISITTPRYNNSFLLETPFKNNIFGNKLNTKNGTSSGQQTSDNISTNWGDNKNLISKETALDKFPIKADVLGINPDYIQLNPAPPATPETEGEFKYNPLDRTIQVFNDNPNYWNLQGQADFIVGLNATGAPISRGQKLEVKEVGTCDGNPVLELYNVTSKSAANTDGAGWAIVVATEDIPVPDVGVGGCGIVCFGGTLLNVDTSMLAIGKPAYLDENGDWSNTRPSGIAKYVLIGTAIESHPTEGVMGIRITTDDYDAEFDGTLLERQDYEIIEGTGGVDGSVGDIGKLYVDVWNREDPARNIPVQLGGTTYQLNTTTGDGVDGRARIEVPQGTDANALKTQIFVRISGGVAVLGVTDTYPLVPFAPMGSCSLWTATKFAIDGPLMNRQTTSSKTVDGMGIIKFILERFGEMPPWVKTGCEPVASITANVMNLISNTGIVFQTSRQVMPALEVVTDGFYIANGSGGVGLPNNVKFTDLKEACGWTSRDEARDTSCTGNLVVYLTINKNESECKIMVNLPSGLDSTTGAGGLRTYNNEGNLANFSGAEQTSITEFSLCRIPYRFNAGTIEFLDPDGVGTTDGQYIINRLREPMGSSGGSGGGGGSLQNLLQVLAEGSSAGGLYTISDLLDAVDPQDATTLSQLNEKAWKTVYDGAYVVGDQANNILIGGSAVGGDGVTPSSFSGIFRVTITRNTGEIISATFTVDVSGLLGNPNRPSKITMLTNPLGGDFYYLIDHLLCFSHSVNPVSNKCYLTANIGDSSIVTNVKIETLSESNFEYAPPADWADYDAERHLMTEWAMSAKYPADTPFDGSHELTSTSSGKVVMREHPDGTVELPEATTALNETRGDQAVVIQAQNDLKLDITGDLASDLGTNDTIVNVWSKLTNFLNVETAKDKFLQLTGGEVDKLGVNATPTYRLDVLGSAGDTLLARIGQAGVSNGLTITSDGTGLKYFFDGLIQSTVSNSQIDAIGARALLTKDYAEDGFLQLLGGVTAERPSAPKDYQTYWDTTLGYSITYNGTAWVKTADGTSL